VFTVQHFLFARSPALACCCAAQIALQFLDFERDGFEGGVRDVGVCCEIWFRHDGVVGCSWSRSPDHCGMVVHFPVDILQGKVDNGKSELFASYVRALAR
jgi:hypothetical protein